MTDRTVSNSYTVLGCVCVVIWASSFGLNGIGSRKLGAFLFGGLAALVGGIVACSCMLAQGRFLQMFRNEVPYYLCCGIPFIMWMVFLPLAFHLATSDLDVVLLSAINNTWPQFMSIFSIFAIGMHWKWSLVPAIILCVVCIFVLEFKQGMGVGEVAAALLTSWQVSLAAAFCACLWASYSTMSTVFASRGLRCTSQPLFLFVAGFGNLALHLIVGEETPDLGAFQDPVFICIFVYYSVFVNALGFYGWDLACRCAHLPTLTAFAYCKAFLATVFSVLELGMAPTIGMFIGSVGITLAASVAAKSVFLPNEVEVVTTSPSIESEVFSLHQTSTPSV